MLAATILIGGFSLEAEAADTLPSVLQEALDSNPELGAIRYNRQAIDHELRAARGLGLPTVDVQSKFGRNRNNLETSAGIKTANDWHSQRDVSVVLSQRVFDGFERTHEVARQKNRVDSARWRVADTANSIALRATQAYFEVQRSDAVLAAAQRNLSSLQGLRARVMRRVDAGHGDSAEGTEAGSRVAKARAVVAEARGRLADAKALFQSVVGRAPRRLASAGPPRNSLPRSVVTAVEGARIAAPSIIATQHDATAARAAIGLAYSRFYPKLNLELGSYHGKGFDGDGDRDLDARAMLVVRWNLFNGGINRARVREAAARASEASEISANTTRVIERETRVSWNAMVAARERLPDLQRQLDLARATRATYSEQFDTGSRRLLDLLDAQDEVFVAEASMLTERFVGSYNAFRVLAAMGKLVEAMGLALPGEAVEPHRRTYLDRFRSPERWHAKVLRHEVREASHK